MPRQGRDIEKLVASLEAYLGPRGIEVESPKRLPDKDTGQLREVDIALQGQIGSSNILVIVECRDQSGDEDVTWIEQLAEKRKSVGADKVIAVSSSGFTKPARNKAEKKNIDLRTIAQVDPKEIHSWFQSGFGTHLITHSLFKDLTFILVNGRIINCRGSNIKAPIFINKMDGTEFSFEMMWESLFKPVIYKAVPVSGAHVEKVITIGFSELENIQMITQSGPKDVLEIIILAELWQDAERVPSLAKRYESGEKSIAEIAEFEYEQKGKKYILGIVSDPALREKQVHLIPKGHDELEHIDVVLELNYKKDDKSPRKQHYSFRL